MKNLRNFIFEKNSDFDGQKELANYIYNKIVSSNTEHITIYKNELKHISYIDFFDKINISCTETNDILTGISRSIYKGNDLHKEKDPLKKLYKEYNFNEDTQNLYDFDISLEIPPDISPIHVKTRISHELNHMYTYWNIVHDDFYEHSDNIKIPEEYHNRLHEWANNIYNKIIKNVSSIAREKFICDTILYSLTTYERNAFLCEINMYLFDNRTNINKMEDVEKVLEKCPQYKIYKYDTPNMLDEIITKWDKNSQKYLVKTYNDIYNKKKTFNQVCKILKHKLDITLKKLDKNIDNLSKMYMRMDEHVLSFPMVTISFDRYAMMRNTYETYF